MKCPLTFEGALEVLCGVCKPNLVKRFSPKTSTFVGMAKPFNLPFRSAGDNKLGGKDLSKDTELMEKLKELARNSKNDNSFDTQKFTDLLKEYTGKT